MNFATFKLRFRKYLSSVLLVCISGPALSVPALQESLIYSNASIESESVVSGSAHQVVLSAPTRINNAPFIEKEQRVDGKKNVMLLRLDSKDSPSEAFAHYRALVTKNGSVAYSCENRGCGISSYWANSILEERRLAGRDSDQYYLAGQIEMAGASYWVSVYLVTNALRQNLVHVTYILQETQNQVWENAYLFLPESKIPVPVVQTLQKQLSKDPTLKLFVVGYSSLDSNQPVSASEQKLKSAFNKVQQALSADGTIPSNRIEFEFVGPFHSEAVDAKEIWFRLFLLKP